MTKLETILENLTTMCVEGTTGRELEAQAENLMRFYNVEPAFLGYQIPGAKTPYPSVMCVSLNGEVIHGFPDEREFEDGDVIKLDIGIKDANGQYDDGATTVLIGKGSGIARRLLKATQEALHAGIKAARTGNTTNDIGAAIEAVAKREELAVIHGFGGHGIGDKLHMLPFVPNEVVPDTPVVELVPGMRIAIEPMFATKRGHTVVGPDGWLIKLAGGGLAAHFEKTITV